MSETVILITVISSALLTPFLNYLYNSRCTHIKCCCMECDRTIKDEEADLEQNLQNQNQNQK
jgi:hypothetical protein